jgi:hypothetical protein
MLAHFSLIANVWLGWHGNGYIRNVSFFPTPWHIQRTWVETLHTLHTLLFNPLRIKKDDNCRGE